MITYIEDLFLTEKTKKSIDKIKRIVEKESFISKACLISLSNNAEDVFDIVPVFSLKFLKNKDILVVGVAESKKAALNLCASLAAAYISLKENNSEVLSDYKDMRSYFERLQ